MAQIINYKCDKCGQSDSKPGFVMGVNVYIDGYKSTYSYIAPSLKADFCQACIESLGMKMNRFQPEEVVQAAAPTIETLLREIIREEMAGNTG